MPAGFTISTHMSKIMSTQKQFAILTLVCTKILIGYVKKVPSMQSFSEISRNTQPKSYTVSLTEYPWEFQNNALWDTH